MKKFAIAMIVIALSLCALFGCVSVDDAEVTITFVGDGETFAVIQAEIGQPVPLPETDPVAEDGSRFAGWSDDENGDVVDLSAVTVSAAATYYAVFEQVDDGDEEGDLRLPTYTVTFKDGLSGETIDEVKVQYGGAATAPQAPSHDGYTFVGWDKPFDEIVGRTEVTAQYSIDSYQLTADVLGAKSSDSVEYGSEIMLADPVAPQGLTFVGWFVDVDGESIPLQQQYAAMPSHDVTAVAAFAIDWTGVAIDSDDVAAAVYGGSVGMILPEIPDLEFKYQWQDGTADADFVFAAAGETELSAQVEARYAVGDVVITDVKTFAADAQVAKAPLSVSVTADAASVIYGDPLPEASCSILGWIGDDGASLSQTMTFVYKTADGSPIGDSPAVGDYSIGADVSALTNYQVMVGEGEFSIVPKALTMTITVGDVVYGESPTPEISLSGFAYDDDASVVTAGEFSYPDMSASGLLDVGSHDAIASGWSADNYTIADATARFEVSAATLTITPVTATSIDYGDEPSVLMSYSGIVQGDDFDAAVTGVADYVIVDAQGEQAPQGLLPVGDYSVVMSGLSAANYIIEYQTASLSVEPYRAAIRASAKVNAGAAWSKSDFAPTLPDGHSFVGTLTMSGADVGEYKYALHEDMFDWTVEPRVVSDGEDVTDNFVFEIDVIVSVEAIPFGIGQIDDFEAEYNGNAIALGNGIVVNNAPEGLTIVYGLSEDAMTESVPTATDAGDYTVYYAISAPNYQDYRDSYNARISPAQNAIETIGEWGTYRWGETIDWRSNVTAKFGTVELADGSSAIADSVGKHSFTLVVAESDNWTDAELTVSVDTIKALYDESDVPTDVFANADIVAGADKTLADIALNEGFAWTYPSESYAVGANVGIELTWCGDPQHYEPYPLTVDFDARKERLTVTVANTFEIEYGAALPELSLAYTAVDESGVVRELPSQMITVSSDRVNISVGGTYPIDLTLDGTMDFYEPVFANGTKSAIVPIKIKSVKVGDALYTIEDALNVATADQVIIAHDTSFAHPDVRDIAYVGDGYRTIKSGVELLVPFSADYTNSAKDTVSNSAGVTADPYVLLTLPEGTHLVVNGTLRAHAQRAAVGGSYSGSAVAHGDIEVQEGATIVAESGSSTYVYGFIYGDGELTFKSGSNLYETFNLYGWKGGSISAAIKDDVFPINQFTLNSLIAKSTIESGAQYKASAVVNVMSTTQTVDVDFVSNDSDAFMQLDSGKLVKYIDEESGDVHFDLYGDSTFNNLKVVIKALIIFDYTMSTEGLQVPLAGHFKLAIKEGSTATIPADVQIKMLPGAELVVEQGATLNVDGKLYGLSDGNFTLPSDKTTWVDGTLNRGYPHSIFAKTHRITPTPSYTTSSAATLVVGGTVNVNSGSVFAIGAYGEDGGKLVVNSGATLSGTIKEDNSKSDDEGTYDITFTAKLENKSGDGYAPADVTAGKTYVCTQGVWA